MISEKNNPGKKHQCPSKAQKDSKYCGVHKGIEKAAVRKDNKEKKCTTHNFLPTELIFSQSFPFFFFHTQYIISLLSRMYCHK